jgi:hypothetical protein
MYMIIVNRCKPTAGAWEATRQADWTEVPASPERNGLSIHGDSHLVAATRATPAVDRRRRFRDLLLRQRASEQAEGGGVTGYVHD